LLPSVSALAASDPELEREMADVLNAALDRLHDTASLPDAEMEQEYAIRSKFLGLRDRSAAEAEATLERLAKTASNPNGRRSAVAKAALEDIATAVPPKQLPRRELVDSLLSTARGPSVLAALLMRPIGPAVILATVFVILVALAPDVHFRLMKWFGIPALAGEMAFVLACSFLITMAGASAFAFLYLREERALRRFLRWRFNLLEEMLVRGETEAELFRVRNILLDAPDAARGYGSALEWAKHQVSPQYATRITP
jgi:hypothetical protein